mgnify:CR=1 FL=1
MKLAYCDYIADRIQKLLDREIGDNETLISNVGNVQMDLHPTEGWFQSTKKVIQVTDTKQERQVLAMCPWRLRQGRASLALQVKRKAY